MPDNFLEPKDDNRDAAYWQCFMNVDDAIVLVAQEKEIIIGAGCAKIVVTKGIPFLAEKTRLYIGTIVVTNKDQRRGIASLLMSHVEEFSKKFNATDALNLLRMRSFSPRTSRRLSLSD
jgi:ribosomal protein S18 acetylase RimI-like enzyme